LVRRRCHGYRPAGDHRLIVAVTVIALEPERRRAVFGRRVEDQDEGSELEGCDPLVLKGGPDLPNPLHPFEGTWQIPDADMKVIESH